MANFTIGELCASQVAQKKGIDNTPSAVVRVHLTETMTLLEAIRAEWAKYCEQYNLGTPSLIVSSGYRYAADIVPANGKQDVFERFMAYVFARKGYAYDQIIIEKNKYTRWVHVGYKKPDGSQRRQCFKLKV